MEEVMTCIASEDCESAEKKLMRVVKNSSEFKVKKSGYFDDLLVHRDNRILRVTADAIAELCKVPENRPAFSVPAVTNSMVNLLSNANADVVMHTMRAIGNLCFENSVARKLIGRRGLQALIDILKKQFDPETVDNKTVCICCGAMMNLVMSDDDLLKACIELQVAKLFETVIKHNIAEFDTMENTIGHLIFVLNMMCEHLIDAWLPLSTVEVLVDVLKVSINPEISCMCLEVLRIQSESDEIKLALAHKGTCELVYDLVQRYGSHVDDEGSRSILKMACDLIVVILTGDASMEFLYDNGKGKVYEQMVFWLNSEDVDLLSTGILAIGNFARNDKHCIQLVDDGLAKKLLGILKYYSNDADTKVQHALLSTLRNLSIPSENKSKLLDENLVDILLSMLNINQSPVEFKLLGTLRMVVDGQEKTAAELIERTDFVGKLVDWCYSEHLGVRGEAPRLLAWLIKNCHSPTSYPSVLRIPKSVKCLVEMMCSMHPVMQNEALLALNLLCASCLTGSTSLDVMLLEADICKNISFMLDKYGEKFQEETVSNIMTLLDQMARNKMLLADIRTSTVLNSLSNLVSCNDHIELIAERIIRYIDEYHPITTKRP